MEGVDDFLGVAETGMEGQHRRKAVAAPKRAPGSVDQRDRRLCKLSFMKMCLSVRAEKRRPCCVDLRKSCEQTWL